MASVFGSHPELGYACRARLDGHRLVSEHVPLIHRLIWSGRLYCPSPDVSCTCSPEPIPPCLYGGVARAGIRHNEPSCPIHVVVGLVHQCDCILMELAQGPRRQIVVVACALGIYLFGTRGRILRQPGPWSIYR